MKNKISIIAFILASLTTTAILNSCSSSAEMWASKTGAQIWGENCIRCHNAPSPDTFSDVEWDVAVLHMRIRANLTADEAKKVMEFLQSAN